MIAIVLALAITPTYAARPPKIGNLIIDGGPDGDQLDVGNVYVETTFNTTSGQYRYLRFYSRLLAAGRLPEFK